MNVENKVTEHRGKRDFLKSDLIFLFCRHLFNKFWDFFLHKGSFQKSVLNKMKKKKQQPDFRFRPAVLFWSFCVFTPEILRIHFQWSSCSSVGLKSGDFLAHDRSFQSLSFKNSPVTLCVWGHHLSVLCPAVRSVLLHLDEPVGTSEFIRLLQYFCHILSQHGWPSATGSWECETLPSSWFIKDVASFRFKNDSLIFFYFHHYEKKKIDLLDKKNLL